MKDFSSVKPNNSVSCDTADSLQIDCDHWSDDTNLILYVFFLFVLTKKGVKIMTIYCLLFNFLNICKPDSVKKKRSIRAYYIIRDF